MKHSILTLLILLLVGCSVEIPQNARKANKSVDIFPDYADVTVPYNIAPLNFHIYNDEASDFVSVASAPDGSQLVVGGQDAQFDIDSWHAMLETSKGKALTVTVYAKQGEEWLEYNPFAINIAEEPIDPYISYRLIEPSYVNYGELTLNQRNITNFDECEFFSNKMVSGVDMTKEYQCVNCHSFQNYHTDNFQFHIRQYEGGTLIVRNGKPERHNIKTDETIGNGVYPSWHPTEPIIAYSLNHTVQAFLPRDEHHKIEVMDTLSDVVLYYVDTNELQIVQNDIDCFESYPSWAPSGDMLYYCSAYFPLPENYRHFEMGNRYQDLHYDVIRQSFDAKTRQLGEPDTVFKASAIGKSATHPRISPDGKYLLFALGDYGNFHLWHKSSDLYLMDLATRDVHRLENLNSDEAESYHTWSSNGRWIIFSTRREDGTFTRPYIAYFDKQGRDYKAFAVPQEDPLYTKRLLKAYNIPEFMVEPVKLSPRELADASVKETIYPKIFKK